MGGQQFGRHGPLQAYFLSLIPSGLTPEEKGALFATEERKPPGHHGRIRFRDFQITTHVRKKLPMPGAFLYAASRETARSSETPYPVSRAGPMKEGPVLPSSERSSPARKRTARPFPWLSDRDAGYAISVRCSATPGSTCRSRPPHEKQRRAAPDGKNPRSADRAPLPPVF